MLHYREDVPTPTPNAGEVLIKVAAAGTGGAGGADEVVDRNADLVKAVGSDSVDVVVDLVVGDAWPSFLEVLKRGGRYTTAGATPRPYPG